jgi:hypothetical protein
MDSMGGEHQDEMIEMAGGASVIQDFIDGNFGLPVCTVVSDDAVIMAWPDCGVRFNSLPEFREYHRTTYTEQCLEAMRKGEVDYIPEWDEFLLDLRTGLSALK